VDDTVRKAVFNHSLPQVPHPRVFTIVQRERVLRSGLGDRDFGVKEAAQKLALKWLDCLDGDLLKFLETFDLVGGDVAEQATFAVLEARPATLESINLEGLFFSVEIIPILLIFLL
jgi:condensin complex subunit 3